MNSDTHMILKLKDGKKWQITKEEAENIFKATGQFVHLKRIEVYFNKDQIASVAPTELTHYKKL